MIIRLGIYSLTESIGSSMVAKRHQKTWVPRLTGR